MLCDWADAPATEEVVIRDAPWSAVRKLVQSVIEQHSNDHVLDQLRKHSRTASEFSTVEEFLRSESDEARRVLGQAAKDDRSGNNRYWFKTIDGGAFIAECVFGSSESELSGTLSGTIDRLREWIHGS